MNIFKDIDFNRVSQELQKDDWGKGPLTLVIVCCDCDSQFEINREAITFSIATNATFLDFMKYVQNGKCRVCEEKNNEIIEGK